MSSKDKIKMNQSLPLYSRGLHKIRLHRHWFPIRCPARRHAGLLKDHFAERADSRESTFIQNLYNLGLTQRHAFFFDHFRNYGGG